MSHCNTDKFNYFWICEPLARCAKRGSSLPLGTPMEIDFTSAYLHYPLPQCSKIVTPIIFSISYELFRLPSAKVPQDYQLLRTFVWKSWPGTMGHFLIRLASRKLSALLLFLTSANAWNFFTSPSMPKVIKFPGLKIPLWKELILQESSFAPKHLKNVNSPTVFTGNYFYAH